MDSVGQPWVVVWLRKESEGEKEWDLLLGFPVGGRMVAENGGREKERKEIIGYQALKDLVEVLETVDKIEMKDGEADQRDGAFFFLPFFLNTVGVVLYNEIVKSSGKLQVQLLQC